MQVFAHGMLRDEAIDENADEGRPHIEDVQTVKAVRDDEDIRRKGRGIRLRLADKNDQIASETAKACVEERARKASEIEIVCDKLGG